jgi:glycerol-3-phosphate dehydrogenase
MPPSLTRDLDRLSSRTFDLLVVGGGIYGLTVACDATRRGLSVALIEKHDFGSGTSFNHLRTIHGGLRYLQTLDIARARESVRERRALARIAPWAVRPCAFVLPLYRSLTRGKAALSVAFLLDRIIAGDRNEGLAASHRLPAGRVLNRDEAQQAYPDLRPLDIDGAAVWYDYVTTEPDRLTLAWALAASRGGAALANYVTATALTTADGAVSGAEAVDTVTGAPLYIRARAVVNATGGHLNQLLEPFRASVDLPLLQAMNLVTTLPAPDAAIGGQSASGRALFLVPWKGRALFGTWESPTTRAPGDLAVHDADVDAFVGELNQAFPSRRLTRADVTLVHRGIVPARIRRGAPPTLEGHELVFEHRAEGLARLISVAGTKYTTARGVAARIVDRLLDLLGEAPRRCDTDVLPLPFVDLSGDDLLRHAAAHESVVTLADAVVRRTSLGALGRPDAATLDHAAGLVGATLGWAPDRVREEIAALLRMY